MRLMPFVILAAALFVRAAVAGSMVKNIADMSTTLGISVISSTSLHENLPYDIFEGKGWRAKPEAQFVRIDMYLDKPTVIGGVEVTFAQPVKNGIELYLNDLDKTLWMVPKSDTVFFDVDYSQKVTSVKFNFSENDSIAIQNIVLFDVNKKPMRIKTSRTVPGSAVAASTLEPNLTYNVMKIFDSKLENGWSSNKRVSGDTISFTFKQSQTITALKLWNGYHRSEIHYQSNSRIKTIHLEGGAGYSQTITVADVMGPQTIALPVKFAGTNLRMIFTESYPGSKYQDLVLSELRFLDAAGSFMVDPLEAMRGEMQHNTAQFTNGKIESMLDREIGIDGPDDNLLIRFRSDGSLFLQGDLTYKLKGHRYFAIGNYEVLKATEDSTNLRLFGYIITQNGKGKYEGPDCGGYYSYVYKDATKRIFTEYLTIQPPKEKENGFVIVNTSKPRNIDFQQQEMYLIR